MLSALNRLERLLRRTLKPQKRGPKPKPKRTSTRRQSGTGTIVISVLEKGPPEAADRALPGNFAEVPYNRRDFVERQTDHFAPSPKYGLVLQGEGNGQVDVKDARPNELKESIRGPLVRPESSNDDFVSSTGRVAC